MTRLVFVVECEVDEDVASLDTVPELALKLKDCVLPVMNAADLPGARAKMMHVAIRDEAEKVMAVFGL